MLDLHNQILNLLLNRFLRQALPAWNGLECHRAASLELIRVNVGLSLADYVGARTIEPGSLQSFSVKQRFDTVDPGPVRRSGDQALFGTLAEDVSESVDLSYRFVAHRNPLMASLEQGASPVVESSDLLGEVGVQMPHEVRDLFGRNTGQEQMEVVGEAAERMQPNVMETLSPGEATYEDLVHPEGRGEQEAALDASNCDFDEPRAIG